MSLPMMSLIVRNGEQSAKKLTPHYKGTNARKERERKRERERERERESVCVCVCKYMCVSHSSQATNVGNPDIL